MKYTWLYITVINPVYLQYISHTETHLMTENLQNYYIYAQEYQPPQALKLGRPRGPWYQQNFRSVFWLPHYFSMLATELPSQLRILATSYSHQLHNSFLEFLMNSQQLHSSKNQLQIVCNELVILIATSASFAKLHYKGNIAMYIVKVSVKFCVFTHQYSYVQLATQLGIKANAIKFLWSVA